MRSLRAPLIVGVSAAAITGAIITPGIASAASGSADTTNIEFSAEDNGDCTATFTVVNTTNSDWARVNYWTGSSTPNSAPPFADNIGSKEALTADPAVEDGDGTEYEPYSVTRSNSDYSYTYVRGLDPVTTTADVDFTGVADQPQGPRVSDGEVYVAYRMTNPDNKDYDTSLKTLVVTGCDTGGDNSGAEGPLGSLGSLFGSLGSLGS